ncbi:MAG TPA: C39 family peptidase [Candidatus Dormibacteraeota bacterium]
MRFPDLPPRVRAAMLAGAIALSVVLSAPIVAAADTSMTIDPLSQQDGAWAGARLGTSPTETIGSAGCAITAVVMMLRHYGIDTDPGSFNAWLAGNGGYAFDDQLIWGAVTTYSGGRVAFSGWFGPDLGLIQRELDAGRPVVAEVQLGDNQHFVLLTGYTSDGGFAINDPWFGDSVSFMDRYGAPASGILSIRTFMPAGAAAPRPGDRDGWLASAVAAVRLVQ